MIRIRKECIEYTVVFLLVMLFVVFLSSCGSITPALPIIHFFTADSFIIDEGDSVTLSWEVTDASTVTIRVNNEIVSVLVALSGSKTVDPSSNTVYTLIATNSAGTITATVTITVNPIITDQTIVIQPGPVEGKDSYTDEAYGSINYGNSETITIGGYTGIEIRMGYQVAYEGYLQFDVSQLPSGADIKQAKLWLYQHATSGTEDFVITLHHVVFSWQEGIITWDNRPFYSSVPLSTVNIIAGATTWLSWDITSLLRGWFIGYIPNNGVVLKGDTFDSRIDCYSSDYLINPDLRPKLEVTYAVP